MLRNRDGGAWLVKVPDGKWSKWIRPDNEEFFAIMSERGACTIDPPDDPPTVPETVAAIAEACRQLNDNAPEGWEVYFDADKKIFPVKFKSKTVTTLDSLALQKILTPEKFFDRFRPLVDNSYTPRQQFLDELNIELDQLQQMRAELGDDTERLKNIDAMIEDVKQTLVENEFAI